MGKTGENLGNGTSLSPPPVFSEYSPRIPPVFPPYCPSFPPVSPLLHPFRHCSRRQDGARPHPVARGDELNAYRRGLLSVDLLDGHGSGTPHQPQVHWLLVECRGIGERGQALC